MFRVTQWEPPTEADTTSDNPDALLQVTAREREFKEKICAVIKKRFEPHRKRYKPVPEEYKQFIRKASQTCG